MKLSDCTWDFKGMWVPKELLFDDRLTWVEKMLASFVYNVDKGDGIGISNEELEDLLSIGQRQARRLLSNLRKFKYIAIEMVGVERMIYSRIDYSVGVVANVHSPCSYLSLLDSSNKDIKKEKENTKARSKMSTFSLEEEKEISEYYLIFKKEYFKKYNIIFSKNGLTSKQKGQMSYIIKKIKKEGLDVLEYITFCFSSNGLPPPEGSTLSIGWVAYRDSIIKFLKYRGISTTPVPARTQLMIDNIKANQTII